MLNLGTEPLRLPVSFGTDLLLASGPDVAVLSDDALAIDSDSADTETEILVIGGETAAWLRT